MEGWFKLIKAFPNHAWGRRGDVIGGFKGGGFLLKGLESTKRISSIYEGIDGGRGQFGSRWFKLISINRGENSQLFCSGAWRQSAHSDLPMTALNVEAKSAGAEKSSQWRAHGDGGY